MSRFSNPLGDFDLLTLHHHNKSPLQAWNAADELLLQHLYDSDTLIPTPKTLIINDQHGALTTVLSSLHPSNHPDNWNDSVCSKTGCMQNLDRNKEQYRGQWIPSTQALTQQYDLVLIKIPKTLSLLEHQLASLRHNIHNNSRIIAAGMVKHLSPKMIQCFEKWIGSTQTSLAKKKARLIFSTPHQQTQSDTTAPAPLSTVTYPIPNTPLILHNDPHVFSQKKLDQGTRFLLEHFPDIPHNQCILDLGCGNGALGCFAAWKAPLQSLHFIDDSHLAINSTEKTYSTNKAHYTAAPKQVSFLANDCLDNIPLNVDMILCNPPFHEGNRLDDNVAIRMFQGAKRCLTKEGKLIIVGNRHLNYHQTLSRFFNKVTLIASNKKFIILSAHQQ